MVLEGSKTSLALVRRRASSIWPEVGIPLTDEQNFGGSPAEVVEEAHWNPSVKGRIEAGKDRRRYYFFVFRPGRSQTIFLAVSYC